MPGSSQQSTELSQHVRAAIARALPQALDAGVRLGLLVDDGVPSALEVPASLVEELAERLRAQLERPAQPRLAPLIVRIVPRGLDSARRCAMELRLARGPVVVETLSYALTLVRPHEVDPPTPSFSDTTRVWVIDDEPIARMLMGRMVQAHGASVVAFPSGDEAVTALQDQSPDLVFLDMSMPGLDGLQTARALREQGLLAPIVGSSANRFVAERQACVQAGMNDYLPKPAQPGQVARMLQTWLPAV